MPKLDRNTQKLFGGNSSQNGQFGSMADGAGVLTNDPDEIQALPAWEGGWIEGAVSGTKLPCLEEMQAIQYVETRQIAYILQEGIPEYDAGTIYYIDSIVKKAGTTELYKSLTDDNEGNALTDGAEWQFLIDLSGISLNSLPITTTTGTTKDFAIPAWVRKIEVNFSGVSIDNTGELSILLGTSAAFEVTGYASNCSSIVPNTDSPSTDEIIVHRSLAAADLVSGTVTLIRESEAANTWVYSGIVSSSAGIVCVLGGSKSLADDLTRFQLTTVAGTAAFDAGSFNVRMEG
jgi:hypothetical protein